MDDIDEYRLEQITADHPIYVGGFIPFAIERLRGRADSTEATLDVHLVDIVGPGEVIRRLRLTWSASSMPAGALAVQERVKTEWAACGVALALLSRYTACRAHYVAREGNRFDYWVKERRPVRLGSKWYNDEGCPPTPSRETTAVARKPVWRRWIRGGGRIRCTKRHRVIEQVGGD